MAKYVFCPYAVNGRSPSDDYDPLDIDEGVVELYNLLRDQFDRVVYLLSKTFEIQCSAGFWQSALKQFLANNGYCYPWLTEANLPYIFAYKGMQQKDVYGQKVKKGSELYEALSNVPNVLLKDAPNEKYAVILKKEIFCNSIFDYLITRNRQQKERN